MMCRADQQFPGAKCRVDSCPSIPSCPIIPQEHRPRFLDGKGILPPHPLPQKAPVQWRWGKVPVSPPHPRAHPTTTSSPVAEIGMGTTGFGVFFILLGVLLYFDSVLLAFGNVSAPALWTAPNLPEVSIAGVNPSSFKSCPSSGQAP